MQFDAQFRELNRKRRGMWSLLCPALNCLIGNEPCVAAAAQIASLSMRPAGDITFVLIRNSDGEPIQLNTAGFREMKNVFVAVVDESLRTNRLEMTERANSCSRFPMGSAFREQLLAARYVAAVQSGDRLWQILRSARSAVVFAVVPRMGGAGSTNSEADRLIFPQHRRRAIEPNVAARDGDRAA